jgi:multiple sugar transport system ATP-binding protein
VAGFIGSPKMNFLDGVVEQVDGDGVLVRYASGEAQRVAIETRGVSSSGARALERGARVTVGIRPEHLHPQPAAAAGGAPTNGVLAHTTTVESLGDAAYLYAEATVAPEGLISRIAPLERHVRGDALMLGADPEHCHLFDEQGQAYDRKIIEVLSAA